MLMEKLVGVASVGSVVVLYLLFGLSFLSLAIALDRTLWFRKRRFDVAALGRKLAEALRGGDVAAAIAACKARAPAVEADAMAAALPLFAGGHEAMAEAMQATLRERKSELEAGLLFLGTLGNNAPFLGLFGTVLGIITAFRELGANTVGAMGNVMSGISEALVATAVGILVALPAVVAYNLFQKRANDVEENLAALSNHVFAVMKSAGRPVFHPANGHTANGHTAKTAGVLAMAGTLGGGKKGGMISGINVTPLVDIVLVLLIILMVASSVIVAQTLKIQLPKSKSSDGSADQPLTLTVQKNGTLRLDEAQITEEQLTERLNLAVKADPEMALVVSADKDTSHGTVVHVLDVAKLVGVTKFAINVQPIGK